MDADAIARKLISEFDHMVRSEGGAIELVGVEPNLIRVGYRMGADPTCESGVCILPHLELQQLMNETLARRSPNTQVQVQLLPPNKA